jgi:hypothetical protein
VTATIDFELKRFLQDADRVFWAGTQPPLARMYASPALYDPAADHRLDAGLHQSFDLVYVVERDLGRVKAWPLVVDEALRLLAPGGRLVLRMTDSTLLSVFELKHQLFAWGGMRPVFEHRCEDGALLFSVRNERTERRPAALDGYSFGVITDGRRPEPLAAFLESVRALRRGHGEAVEVLVCGPAHLRAGLAGAFPEAVFVEADAGFESQGWITRKKNQLVARARHENVVIAHDRYTIEPDFLERMREFGADWSFVVCRQVRPDGRRFPDWVALGSEWAWSAPGMLEYGDWTRHLYINGGIMIAKAECLRAIPWNELLFWNQAEDVELTRRLRARGHVPRLARRVTACSRVWRAGTIESFEPLPRMEDRYVGPGPRRADGVVVAPGLAFAETVRFGAAWSLAAARQGVQVDEHWTCEDEGLALAARVHGEIACRLQVAPAGDVAVTLDAGPVRRGLEITVNDAPQPFEEVPGGGLRLVVPRARFAVNRVLRMHVRCAAPGFRLRALRAEPAGWVPGAPLPFTPEAAHEAAGRPVAGERLDGASLCLADLPLLARGARRIAVVLPGDLASLVSLAGFLAALRAHVRSDAVVRLVAEPGTHPLLEGFDLQAVDWPRFVRDAAFRETVSGSLAAFAPELLIHAFPVRTLASDMLVHGTRSVALLAFDASDYASDPAWADAVRARATRRLPPGDAGASDALRQALGLPEVPARLWPDAAARERAAAALAPLAGRGNGCVAVLGDDPEALARPAVAREIDTHLAAGRLLVGLGGRGTFDDLSRALAKAGDRAVNHGEALALPAIVAALECCDDCVGGSPLFRALAEAAGCGARAGRPAADGLQLQC